MPGLTDVHREHPVGVPLHVVRKVSDLGCGHPEPAGRDGAGCQVRHGNGLGEGLGE